MNDNGERTKRCEVKLNQYECKEQEQMRRAILRYTEELQREMNLRLVTEQSVDTSDPWNKYLMPEKILYVDSITVTDIRYPNK